MPENKAQIILEAVNKFNDTFNELEQQTKSSTNILEQAWVGVAAEVTAAYIAFQEVKGVIEALIAPAALEEQTQNRLVFAVQSAGYAYTDLKGRIDAYVTSMEESTRFSDTDAKQALINMLLYTRDYEKALKGAEIAMNVSVRTGNDLQTSTRLVGMALSGNVEMMGRWIPEFRNLDAVLGANATQTQKAEYAMRIFRRSSAERRRTISRPTPESSRSSIKPGKRSRSPSAPISCQHSRMHSRACRS